MARLGTNVAVHTVVGNGKEMASARRVDEELTSACRRLASEARELGSDRALSIREIEDRVALGTRGNRSRYNEYPQLVASRLLLEIKFPISYQSAALASRLVPRPATAFVMIFGFIASHQPRRAKSRGTDKGSGLFDIFES